MTPAEIRIKLATLIAARISPRISAEQVQWDTRLRDQLGIHSRAMAELMCDIEETFGTALEETDPARLVTLRDAVDAIVRELQTKLAS